MLVYKTSKNRRAVVMTDYGVCDIACYDLLKGNNPTIQSSVDKTSYFKKYFKFKQPRLSNIIKIIGNYNDDKKKDINTR